MTAWKVANALHGPNLHDEELVEAIVGAKRRHVHIHQVHAHLMVAQAEIELREELSAVQLIQELIDDKDGEVILHRDGIEGLVVDAEAP
jgi:hypothetical protein